MHHSQYLRESIISETHREIEEITLQNDKQILVDVTKVDQHQAKEQSHQSSLIEKRSLRTRFDSFEISFQQGILDQHKNAQKKIFEEFIKKVFPSYQHGSLDLKNDIFHDSFLSDGYGTNLILQIKENPFFDDNEKKLFIQDVYHQQQLDRFLIHICETNLRQIGFELIWLAHLIWLKYIEVRSSYPTEAQHSHHAEKFSQDQAESIFNDFRVKYINLRNRTIEAVLSEQEIYEGFKVWLKKYAQTLLLVIDGFFVNPYHHPRSTFPKRQLEKVNSFFYTLEEPGDQSSQDSMEYLIQGAPRKRIKF